MYFTVTLQTCLTRALKRRGQCVGLCWASSLACLRVDGREKSHCSLPLHLMALAPVILVQVSTDIMNWIVELTISYDIIDLCMDDFNLFSNCWLDSLSCISVSPSRRSHVASSDSTTSYEVLPSKKETIDKEWLPSSANTKRRDSMRKDRKKSRKEKRVWHCMCKIMQAYIVVYIRLDYNDIWLFYCIIEPSKTSTVESNDVCTIQ